MTEPAVEFAAILPLLIVGGGALGAVLLESLFGPGQRGDGDAAAPSSARVGAVLSLYSAFVLLAAIIVAVNAGGVSNSFYEARPLIVFDPLARFATVLLSFAGMATLLLFPRYLQKLRIHRGEAHGLLLLSVAGALLLVSSVDLLAVFLGVEGMCLPLYVLAGLDRHRRTSSEAALKFHLLGTFASAFSLFGIALIYGATGATGFAAIQRSLPESGVIAAVGAAMLCTGLAARIAAVPFHAIAPDVEEGAPTPVAGFISVAVKSAAFIALLRVVQLALASGEPAIVDAFRVIAVATVAIGALMAVVQENVKRMLAYVGIANLGFLFVALLSPGADAVAAVLFSLVALGVSNIGAFAVLVVMADRGRGGERLSDFTGLGQRRPALATALSLFLFSLVGIPGTAGFIAKLQLMSAAVRAEEMFFLVSAGLANLLLLYGVLRVPVAMFMNPKVAGASRPTAGSAEGLVLLACAAAVLLFGLVPNGLADFDGFALIDWATAAAQKR
jgi:NADH-quinone oxidoreductase subunit N